MGNEVIVQDASSLAIGLYAKWGLLMNQATQASVGTDPWTVIQNRLHPAVSEAEIYSVGLVVPESSQSIE
jgi:hypothetical protein